MQCGYSDIELLFLVGGFAESAMLQADMRQQFGQRVKIAIPQEASLAILKGITGDLIRRFVVLYSNDASRDCHVVSLLISSGNRSPEHILKKAVGSSML